MNKADFKTAHQDVCELREFAAKYGAKVWRDEDCDDRGGLKACKWGSSIRGHEAVISLHQNNCGRAAVNVYVDGTKDWTIREWNHWHGGIKSLEALLEFEDDLGKARNGHAVDVAENAALVFGSCLEKDVLDDIVLDDLWLDQAAEAFEDLDAGYSRDELDSSETEALETVSTIAEVFWPQFPRLLRRFIASDLDGRDMRDLIDYIGGEQAARSQTPADVTVALELPASNGLYENGRGL